MKAADKGRTGELIAGLLTLLAIIILMDGIVWQPLSTWAEKFRYEFAARANRCARSVCLRCSVRSDPAMLRCFRAILRPLLRR